MYAFNRRFRPREVGGVPLLSAMMFLLCCFLLGAIAVYDILFIRVICAGLAAGAFLIGTLHFIFMDDLLFTDSFFANRKDVTTKFVGGDEE